MPDIKFEKIIDYIVPYLDKSSIDFVNEIITSRCPLCGDSTTKKNVKRFILNYYPEYDTYTYKCHRCGLSSNAISLLAELSGESYDEAKNKLSNKKYDSDIIKNKFKKEKKPVIKDSDVSFTIFNDFIKNECYSVNDEPEGRQDKRLVERLKTFINERKPTKDCFVCHSGKFKSRIIIPIYDENNNIIYFQGRCIYNHILPKYLNPETEKDIIFNFHEFKKDKYIIVTEGILDADSVEYNQGTTILGASLKDDFLEKLFKKTDKGVILSLDNYRYDDQSVKTIMNIKEKLKYHKKIRYFIFPEKYKIKDLNQLKTEYKDINIYDFVIKNSFPFDIFWIKFNSLKW